MYSRLAFVLLLLVPASILKAQTSEASKDCSLSSLQICALHVAQDEAGLVTAPFHFTTTNFLWVASFGAVTGYLIDKNKDQDAILKLGVDKNREDKFAKISDVGGIYIPVAATGFGYIVGNATHDTRMKETAVLAGEAMADAIILNKGLGYAIDRETPKQDFSKGRFWPHGTKTWPDGQSMASDHAVLAWSFARVVSSQYNGIATKALLYSMAATVSASRVVAREHFPSDVIIGSGLGYAIGGYVLRRRSSESPLNNIAFSTVQTPNGRAMQISYNFAH
jgi:membrane-associated phospholipid phosphatase